MPSIYKYSKVWGVCQIGAVYDKLPYMLTNCITCKTKLIPIVYDRVDPEYITLMAKGEIIISLDKNRRFNSFCPLCEEHYQDYTDTPLF